jgi:hypothetical protein
VPGFSTLCRRQGTVTIQILYRRSGGNLNLLIDSTGVKVRGDGEWQVRRHGPAVAGNGARCIWPWVWGPGTFVGWRSQRAR